MENTTVEEMHIQWWAIVELHHLQKYRQAKDIPNASIYDLFQMSEFTHMSRLESTWLRM